MQKFKVSQVFRYLLGIAVISCVAYQWRLANVDSRINGQAANLLVTGPSGVLGVCPGGYRHFTNQKCPEPAFNERGKL